MTLPRRINLADLRDDSSTLNGKLGRTTRAGPADSSKCVSSFANAVHMYVKVDNPNLSRGWIICHSIVSIDLFNQKPPAGFKLYMKEHGLGEHFIGYRLYMKERGLKRVIAPHEKPLVLHRHDVGWLEYSHLMKFLREFCLFLLWLN
ncbi:hypothetical protein VP01_457g1 [Puccinia sorghi]|uniref:Uncharacterized protein n=1 Tax=Puccinia sorghi TaxID=27349 RepID=A0A0L6UPE4_9BASI|nr:hypothetical protein VP01_457g1 [Puccinia sorghi]